MIKKVILIGAFFFLLIAIILSMMGYTRISMSTGFIAFLHSTSEQMEDFKIEIPSIPMIPRMDNVEGFLVVINVLITFVNGLSSVINILIQILNIFIQLLQFIFTMIINLKNLTENVTSESGYSVQPMPSIEIFV